MTDTDTAKSIYNYALGILARREHSRHELRQKLLQRHPGRAELIDHLLTQLESEGCQSDQRYTDAYIRSRRNKGYGFQRILQELRIKGIASDIIETVLMDQPDIASEQQLYQVWQKKFKVPPKDWREKARQSNFLRFRGFSAEEIERLFAQVNKDQ